MLLITIYYSLKVPLDSLGLGATDPLLNLISITKAEKCLLSHFDCDSELNAETYSGRSSGTSINIHSLKCYYHFSRRCMKSLVKLCIRGFLFDSVLLLTRFPYFDDGQRSTRNEI